jgi:hypothetical protein
MYKRKTPRYVRKIEAHKGCQSVGWGGMSLKAILRKRETIRQGAPVSFALLLLCQSYC